MRCLRASLFEFALVNFKFDQELICRLIWLISTQNVNTHYMKPIREKLHAQKRKKINPLLAGWKKGYTSCRMGSAGPQFLKITQNTVLNLLPFSLQHNQIY